MKPGWMRKIKPLPLAPAFSSAAPRVRKSRARRREGSIEETCRQSALALGWASRKMNGLGFRSWPDRFFIPPVVGNKALRAFSRGNVAQMSARLEAHQVQKRRGFWVEFKRVQGGVH